LLGGLGEALEDLGFLVADGGAVDFGESPLGGTLLGDDLADAGPGDPEFHGDGGMGHSCLG